MARGKFAPHLGMPAIRRREEVKHMDAIIVRNANADEIAALVLAVRERHGLDIMTDSGKFGQEICKAITSCGPIKLESRRQGKK